MPSRSLHKKVLAIIPARYASERLPGKMMQKIQGKTLIQRTYENTKKIPFIDEILIATDHRAIFDHVSSFAKVVMTSPSCLSGTDRAAEALIQNREFDNYSIILNIQGDEPLLPTSTVEKLISLIRSNEEIPMATAITPLSIADAMKNSCVKCVKALDGRALYFSRSVIPGIKEGIKVGSSSTLYPHYFLHIGVYAFQRDFLLTYAKLPPAPLQLIESLEQLKALEHGFPIYTVEVETSHPGIDTPEDVQTLEAYLWQQNSSS